MVTGLMNGVGTERVDRSGAAAGGGGGERVITFERFREACEDLGELDALLTLTFPQPAPAPAQAQAAGTPAGGGGASPTEPPQPCE
jgi:hypothetical protein